MMAVYLLLAVILWTGAAWGQEIFCGYGLTEDDSGATRSSGGSASSFAEFTPEEEHFHDGTIKMLVLFATFSDITTAPYDLESDHFEGRSGNTDRSALDLLDVTVSGSFSHYMKEMSRETLTVQGANRTIVTKWYRSKFDSAMFDAKYGCASWNYKTFGTEVLEAAPTAYADVAIDYEDYDALAVVVPEKFNKCRLGGIADTFSFLPAGSTKKVSKDMMVLKGETFPEMVAIMAHEYGHFMGLPELYDRSGFNHLIKQRRNAWIAHHTEGDPLPLATDVFTKLYNADLRQQSAGIGYWSVMGGGSLKWYYPDNPEDTRSFPPPQPMGAWSRVFADWVTDVEIAESGTFTLNDMSAETKVYKISIGGTQQHFLIENRQNTFTEESVGSMYADHGAMSGLMIWHVDENTGYGSIDANEWEERKGVDLESAEGLFGV